MTLLLRCPVRHAQGGMSVMSTVPGALLLTVYIHHFLRVTSQAFSTVLSTPPVPTTSFSTYFCFKGQLGAIRYSYKIQELDGFNPENIINMTVRENADIIFKIENHNLLWHYMI